VTSLVHACCTLYTCIFSHDSSKFSDHVIIPFDIIIQCIKSFRGVYLPFKHYIFEVQIVVDNYLILPKVFLEKIYFRDSRPLDKSIPVVSSSFWTTGRVLHPRRYEL